MQLLKITVKAADILERAIANAKARYVQIEIELDRNNQNSAEIEADPERITQALANLLCHIACQNKTGKIRIRSALTDAGFSFELFDEGPTLTAEQRTALFQRISVAEQAEEQNSGHSALALPLAASIIKAHAGTINIFPAENGGNVYRIVLPSTDRSLATRPGTEEADDK